MKLKKRFMLLLWRVQQAQVVISIVFWSLTLTGVFYPYVSERFLNDVFGADRVALGMAIMFFGIFALVLIGGTLYDRFRFWREQITVAAERNPYQYGGKMNPVMIVLWAALLNPTPDTEREALALIEHNLEDPEIRKAYYQILRDIGMDVEDAL